ncbi:MAG: hypothetical protein ACLQAH_16490 [Limisphaerales bacterium]
MTSTPTIEHGLGRWWYRHQGLSKSASIDRLGFEIVMVTKTRKDTRPKRTKSSSRTVAEPAPEPSTKPGADVPLPTVDTLALIAANVSKGIDLEPRLAVDYAFKLWKNAREKLEGEIKEPAPVPNDNEKIQKSDGGCLPLTFPATFDAFLRMVVNGKTPADSTKRFRDFLRHNSATEDEADKRMAKLGDEGFRNSESWQVTALEYRDWWESQESQESPLAGKPAESPMPPPKASLPTFDTFLRTVVKGETNADSEKRFCAFLRSKFPEPEADEQMAKLSKEGFKDIGSWLETARQYRDWCKSEK